MSSGNIDLADNQDNFITNVVFCLKKRIRCWCFNHLVAKTQYQNFQYIKNIKKHMLHNFMVNYNYKTMNFKNKNF